MNVIQYMAYKGLIENVDTKLGRQKLADFWADQAEQFEKIGLKKEKQHGQKSTERKVKTNNKTKSGGAPA